MFHGARTRQGSRSIFLLVHTVDKKRFVRGDLWVKRMKKELIV
jgi:hypothetical protein